ncbi:MAG: hypothetical protein KDD47_22795, partial [Acidobacteria bacterium]|nr:hypothetical protein [Acidobacteriota bacterium]
WIERCSCTAFLAPAWSVGDSTASRFTEVFYEALAAGQTLGQATLTARHALRADRPGDTAWLAYRLYGPPNARIYFGDQAPAGASEPPPRPTTVWTPPPARVSPSERSDPHRSPTARPARLRNRILASSAAAVLFVLGWIAVDRTLLGHPAQQASQSTSTTPGSISNPSGSSHELGSESLPGGTGGESGAPNGEAVKKSDPTDLAEPVGTSEPAPPPSPGRSSVSYQPPVGGRVAVLALDGGQQPDFQLGSALRSVVNRSDNGTSALSPEADVSLLRQLARGIFPFQVSAERTPWGAEYILMASGSIQSLPDSPNLSSLSLTLNAALFDARDGRPIQSAAETHTGRGATADAALLQATERCLSQILDHLNQGDV